MSPRWLASALPAGADPSKIGAPCKSEAGRTSPLVDWKPSGPRSTKIPTQTSPWSKRGCSVLAEPPEHSSRNAGFCPKRWEPILGPFISLCHAAGWGVGWAGRSASVPGVLREQGAPVCPRSPLCALSGVGEERTITCWFALADAGGGCAAEGCCRGCRWWPVALEPWSGRSPGCSRAWLLARGRHVLVRWGEHMELPGRGPAALAPVAHLQVPGKRGFIAEHLPPPVPHPTPGTARTSEVRFGEHCMGQRVWAAAWEPGTAQCSSAQLS